MYYTERYAEGRYFVYRADPGKKNPQRIGHIIGAKDAWSAEQGPAALGAFKTKRAAAAAINERWERAQATETP